MKDSALIRGGLAVALSLAASACTPAAQEPPDLGVRPLDQGAENISADNVYYQQAVTAINQRDYAAALDYLQFARAKNPNNVRVLNAFGVVYDKLGRFDLSARYYAQASALDPGSPTVAHNVAYSRLLQGIMGQQVAAASAPAQGENTAATSQQADVPAAVERTALRLAELGISLPRDPSTGTAMAASPIVQVGPNSPSAATAAPVAASSRFSSSNVHPAFADSQPVPGVPALQPLAVEPTALDLDRTVPSIKPLPSAVAIGVNMASMALAVVSQSVPLVRRTADPVADGLSRSPVPPVPPGPAPRVRPLRIVNGSGEAGAGDPIRRSLLSLGWRLSKVSANAVSDTGVTTIVYPAARESVAQTLARTLPFHVQLRLDSCGCNGFQLVVGSDFLKWKPVGRYVPDVWRQSFSLAALDASKGVR